MSQPAAALFRDSQATQWARRAGEGLTVTWPIGLSAQGTKQLVDLIAQTPGTIGYAELNFAKDANLSVASIQNRAGAYIEPSVDGTSAALDAFSDAIAKDPRSPIVDAPATAKDAYPLSGITFFIIPKDGTDQLTRQTVRDFAQFAVSVQGQADADGLYYAKLPKLLQDGDQKLLSQMTLNGQPIQ